VGTIEVRSYSFIAARALYRKHEVADEYRTARPFVCGQQEPMVCTTLHRREWIRTSGSARRWAWLPEITRGGGGEAVTGVWRTRSGSGPAFAQTIRQLLCRGTRGLNPSRSSEESANFRSLCGGRDILVNSAEFTRMIPHADLDDRLPSLGANRRDRLVQHRLLWRPRQRQTGQRRETRRNLPSERLTPRN